MKSMTKKAISLGAVHSVPADLRKVLISDAVARAKWEEIGLTDQFVIENYLVPPREAKDTKFVHDRGRLKQGTGQALEASGTQRSILHSNFAVATLHAIQRNQSSLGLKS